MLPNLDARGKESGKRPWESRDSGWTSRVDDPGEGSAAAVSGKWLGTLAPTTARCEPPTRGFPTKARDAIHHPAIRGKYAGAGSWAIGEEHDLLRKAKESSQKNERTRNLENDGAGAVALFITESPKHRMVPNMELQKFLSVPKAPGARSTGKQTAPPKRAYRHLGTTRVGEQASDDLPKLDSVSRGTFQWSRTSPGEPSGHFHGKQRSQRSPSTSQRSPSTSRHSGNAEKTSVKVPRSSRANGP
ncbi:hypothetical protein CRG98_018274 [Punica granatum]|uniref:Uncharacterized protein n=1 Tax=Punica granatum TaxID=22663 RepID=A0A2I0JYC8_PUNGR|nr:hypothetical protein CRG98_018274 [Punica granatum]